MKKYLMKMVNILAEESKCEKAKVGAIITRGDRVISSGWNGSPKGIPNQCEGPEGKTFDHVIHAEANAIAFAARHGVRTEGANLYCTYSPCMDCAKVIIQSGISKVYYSKDYRDARGTQLMVASGITVERV